MKVAVASDDRVGVASHFGRCAGFLVFEVTGDEVKEVEFRENRFGHHGVMNGHQGEQPGDHHGHGHHGHDRFADALQDCEAVICRGMGQRAMEDLAGRGIRAVVALDDIPAVEVAGRYARGTLTASSDGGCRHRHGSCH